MLRYILKLYICVENSFEEMTRRKENYLSNNVSNIDVCLRKKKDDEGRGGGSVFLLFVPNITNLTKK